MIYKVDKCIILESEFFQEEMSNIAKNGMKLAGAGAAIGMGHAGAFGGGVKGMIDSTGEAIANGAGRASTQIGNMMNTTQKFYKNDGTDNTAPANQAVQDAKHSAAADTPANDADDDDSGLGVLGTIGAGTLAAGAGYLGLKGAGKTKMGKKFGNDFKMGNIGGSITNPGIAHKLGKGLYTGRQRTSKAFNALRGK